MTRKFSDRNLKGQKFERLLVLEQGEPIRCGKAQKRRKSWICKCDCGNEIPVAEHSLLTGNTKSCGCLVADRVRESKFHDLKDKEFGRLKVISLLKRDGSHILWNCKCSCGNSCVVRGSNLVTGTTESCGCLKLERITKHGLCKKGKTPGEYMRFKRQDPLVKLRNRISNSIRKSLKKNRGIKDGIIFDYLPYSLQELKEHLESQFEEWMSWDNYGGNLRDSRKTWHIDHIIPHSSFNYISMGDPEFLACWDLSNLRPLEKCENRKKWNY